MPTQDRLIPTPMSSVYRRQRRHCYHTLSPTGGGYVWKFPTKEELLLLHKPLSSSRWCTRDRSRPSRCACVPLLTSISWLKVHRRRRLLPPSLPLDPDLCLVVLHWPFFDFFFFGTRRIQRDWPSRRPKQEKRGEIKPFGARAGAGRFYSFYRIRRLARDWTRPNPAWRNLLRDVSSGRDEHALAQQLRRKKKLSLRKLLFCFSCNFIWFLRGRISGRTQKSSARASSSFLFIQFENSPDIAQVPAGAKKNENKHQKTYYDDDDDERLRSGGCGRAHAPPENTFTRANYRKEKRERKRRFLKEKERERVNSSGAPRY